MKSGQPDSEHTGADAGTHEAVGRAIARRADRIVALSHGIHDAAELAFAEHRSVALVARLLGSEGYPCELGAYGVETAFRAVAGPGPGPGSPRVAILAEYDALPGIGHGCGHNVIAAVAVAAFLGLAEHIERIGGSVVLIGTPAEENGGGKELLARAGAFDGVDAAVMIHPGTGPDAAHVSTLGCRGVEVTYHGVPAHAAADPEQGRNALDAMVAAYQGIAALRQHIPGTDRLHAIITEGGTAVNVVPATARGTVLLRSATLDGLTGLTARVQAVLQGAALITGTRLEAGWDPVPPYLPLRSNATLAGRYAAHAVARGRTAVPVDGSPGGAMGSTDMGNVSLRVPSIHPMVGIAPAGVALHTAGFATHAASAETDAALSGTASALASTVADFLADEGLRRAARKEFEQEGGAVDVPAALSRIGNERKSA